MRLRSIIQTRGWKHPQTCVEYSGLEPLTSTLPVSRSSQNTGLRLADLLTKQFGEAVLGFSTIMHVVD